MVWLQHGARSMLQRLPEPGRWLSPVAALVLVLLPLTDSRLPLGLVTGLALVLLACAAPRGPLLALPITLGLVYQPVPIGLGGARVSASELLIVASAAGAGLRATWSLIRHPGRSLAVLVGALEQISGLRFSGPAIGLLIVGTVSLGTLADNTHLRESLREYRWVVVEPVVAYFLYIWYLREPSDRWRVVSGWIASATAVGLYSMLAGLTGSGVLVEGVLRISGVHPHPNALALYLERPLLLAATLALLGVGQRALWAGAAILLVSAVLLTFSRGALASVVVTLSLACLFARRYREALVLAGVMGSVAFALVLTAPERILTLFQGGSGTLRLHVWSAAFSMLRDYPLFGVGLDQFLYQYVPRYVAPEAWPERFTSHPHNLALDAWLRLGLAGVTLLACGAIILLRCLLLAGRQRNTLAIAASWAIVVGGIHGLVDNGYFLPDLALAFWLLAAILELELSRPAQHGVASRSGLGQA